MVRGKCTVCDSPNATNYHFGAQSCKACAAFFRRSIAMGQCYECLGDGVEPCRIDHTLRLNCRHCRLKKCFKAGMLKDLVQAKREIRAEPSTSSKSSENIRNSISQSEDCGTLPQPGLSSIYFEQYSSTSAASDVIYYPASENEWDISPPSPKFRKINDYGENLMGIDELQQYIQYPGNLCDDYEIRSQMTSLSDSSIVYISGLEEEERLFALAALYTDQVIDLNMRRRITYTDKMLGSVFDGPCICPYDDKNDLKLFHHETYRKKSRNDYTMILDYVNRFPEFENLSKSEKTVLFRTATAVDLLADQAYYSQLLFPDDDILVTANGEYLPMNPLPMTENQRDSGNFHSDDDYDRFKMLTSMKIRQWQHVCKPLKNLKMSLTEFSLFKAMTIWHHNYYKLQEMGKQVCSRQRDDIFRSLLLICDDEGHEDPMRRASEIVLAVGIIMEEVHVMVTSYIEISVYNVLDDPILNDMLKFQY